MVRGVDDRNILDDFTISFCDVVSKYCRYIIVSGFVVISSGRTRATEDIDMIIERISLDSFKKLHNALLNQNFVCVQTDDVLEIYDYLHNNISVRYTYKDEPLPEMELKFAKDGLDDIQIQTKAKLPLTGLDIWFSNVEMNIAFKEHLLKSDKDLKDAQHLRLVYDVDEYKITYYKSLIERYRL
ncbi:MAG: hypothetical protein ACMXYK_01630 [Candidatus Woesearchaeota archaeon]